MNNTEKFTGKAAIYDKYRPGYPDALIEHLVTAARLNETSLAADIGAGTGKLSRCLLRRMRVAAVEPNADMRGEAEASLAGLPGYRSLDGTAEHTGLSESSVDLVTAAQAFHWFDLAAFRAECRRILKPGAPVALIWNTRGPELPLHAQIRDLFQDLDPSSREAGMTGMDRTPHAALESFFENGRFETVDFENPRDIGLEAFVGYHLSKSYSPKKNDPLYGPFVDALTDLFQKYSQNGLLTLHEVTRCYIGRV